MHRSAPLVLALAATLGLCPVAVAQRTPAVPADAAVVAGPTAKGATLVAFDRAGQTCLAVRGPGPQGGGDLTCLARAPLRLERFGPDAGVSGSDPLFGATAPGVASVEVVAEKGAVATTAVADGAAYHGRLAGRAGFWIMDAPGTAAPGRFPAPWRLARWRDATGAVVSAIENPFRPDAGAVRPAGDVASGRIRGHGTWRARAVTQRVLRPSAAQPERYEDETCLRITTTAPGSDDEATCESPWPAQGLAPLTTTVCGATLAGGLTGAATARVVVAGTDGRRVVAATRPVAGRPDGRRAFVTALPAGDGVRSMTELDRGGRRRGTIVLGLAPATGDCGTDFGVSGAIVLTVASASSPPPPSAGPPHLVVGDRGDLLCVDLDALRPDGADCSPFEPLSILPGEVLDRATATGSLIAGVALPEVATVEIATTSGRRITTPTTDDIGYTGPYRGHVRFFSVAVPGRDRAAWVRFADAGGRTLWTGQSRDPPFARPPAIRARAGGVALSAGAVWQGRRQVPCLALTTGAAPTHADDCEGLTSRHEALVRVLCGPRAVAVTGLAAPGVRRAELELAGGGRRALRLIALPGGGRAYFGVTRPGDIIRGVRLEGGGRERLQAQSPLPAARAQCGYATHLLGRRAFSR